MKVVGIIAEYNPFHLGHQYQIECIKKEADYVVVAMSGDFVQRGAAAILEKHDRARMALAGGADLVLELPVQASTASAEFFASAGVSVLDSLGAVSALCFGSECGEVEPLMKIAEILNQEPEEFKSYLREALQNGLSFPAARSRALEKYAVHSGKYPKNLTNDSDPAPGYNGYFARLLSSPNNILGVEYCRAILRRHSTMTPVTIRRSGAAYHTKDTTTGEFPSALAVRALLTAGDTDALTGFLPDVSFKILTGALARKGLVADSDFDEILHYCLLNETGHSLKAYADMPPELSERILHHLNEYRGFSQYAELLKTKNLTLARIRRSLLHALLHIKEQPRSLPYARVLGFRREASPLLSEIKKEGKIPLLTKLADAETLLSGEALALFEQNTRVSNIYESLLCKKEKRAFVHEYQKPVVIL